MTTDQCEPGQHNYELADDFLWCRRCGGTKALRPPDVGPGDRSERLLQISKRCNVAFWPAGALPGRGSIDIPTEGAPVTVTWGRSEDNPV